MSSYFSNMEPAKVTRICGTLGIMSTTVFFSMNTTINYLTIPVLLLGQSPKNQLQSTSPNFFIPSTGAPATSVSHLNRQWQELYWRGHRVGIPSALFSGITLGTAAYFSKCPVHGLLFAAAGSVALLVVPYTLIWMVPTNDELHRRGDLITHSSKETKDINEQETEALLTKWIRMSKVRASIALVATILGVTGLLL